MIIKKTFSFLFILFVMQNGRGEEMVSFAIPQEVNPQSCIALNPDPIETNSARVMVDGEHFYRDHKRFRVWGVNTSFDANMPTHEHADLVAKRLGSAGINCVRITHLDTNRYPRGIFDPIDASKFSDEGLERLDYFVSALAKNGVYSDLNLHVGRGYSKGLHLPAPPTQYDKLITIFTPPIIEEQKKFARAFLSRTNQYRKVRYLDDPAIAFVEITNEDSLFMTGTEKTLRQLPEYYQNILNQGFNKFLKTKYGNNQSLESSWLQGVEPLGASLIYNKTGTNGWNLKVRPDCDAQLESKAPGAFRIVIKKADATNWHIQLIQNPVGVKKDHYYTFSFKARAEKPRSIGYALYPKNQSDGRLGLNGIIQVSNEWENYKFGFTAKRDDPEALLSFDLSGEPVSIEFSDIVLAPGGREGLLAGEALIKENIKLFAVAESENRAIDRNCFLLDTEKEFFDSMYSYLKNDLGVKSLVTGTMVYGLPEMYAQTGMDFLDTHAYWQHPKFPDKKWSASNWALEQKALVDNPGLATLEGTLPRVAATRVKGKPFTVTEYNHPAPNDFQAECVPMAAAYAAAQDWDGVWFYCYSQKDELKEFFNNNFDIAENPGKWGFVRAGHDIFCRDESSALGSVQTVDVSSGSDSKESVAKFFVKYNREVTAGLRDMLGRTNPDVGTWAKSRLKLAFGGGSSVTAEPSKMTVSWTTNSMGHGTFRAETPYSLTWISSANADKSAAGGPVRITAPGFSALTMTTLDSRTLNDSKQILVTGCGRSENSDMGFTPDRRSVSTNWGKPPTLIETVTGKIELPGGKWKCFALKSDGTRGETVEIIENGSKNPAIQMSAKARTMWYLAEKE